MHRPFSLTPHTYRLRTSPPVLADADALEAFGAAAPAVIDAALFAPSLLVSFLLAYAGLAYIFLVVVAKVVSIMIFSSKRVFGPRTLVVVARYTFLFLGVKTGVVSDKVCPASEDGLTTCLLPASFPSHPRLEGVGHVCRILITQIGSVCG